MGMSRPISFVLELDDDQGKEKILVLAEGE